MVYYIHVNRQRIDGNRKNGTDEPPVRYQRGVYGKSHYCHELEVTGTIRVVYDGQQRLPCGARLLIETDVEPTVIR